MIFGNKNFIKRYDFLGDKVLKCFEYAQQHNLLDYKAGSYKIDEDRIFVNIVEYETKTKEERFWEAHRKYIDLHLMLSGTEQIDLNFIENMEQKQFVEKDDFLPLNGESNCHVVLNDGDFLICYPEDAHMTAIKINDSVKIKKAIFKVIL